MNGQMLGWRSNRFVRIGIIIIGILLLLALGIFIAFQVSPLPAVLLIRNVPGGDGLDAARRMAHYVPEDIASIINERYADNSPDTFLDVFYPEDTTERLPTIVWVHGGGFIAGTKDALWQYLPVLASHGYTVVSVEYTKGPEAQYPTPIVQLNQALEYVIANAERLHVDAQQLVLAGDSAGAHIAAQAALAITNPDYAREAGLPAAIDAGVLRAVILCSGPYDVQLFNTDAARNSQFGSFMRTVMWAYTGDRNFLDSPRSAYLSVTNYITSSYPPAFITTGPYDPLLQHSEILAAALESHGVEVDALFFPAETTDPAIGHEYQLDLDTLEARQAMKHMIALMRSHTQTPDPRVGVSDAW